MPTLQVPSDRDSASEHRWWSEDEDGGEDEGLALPSLRRLLLLPLQFALLIEI